MTAALARLPLFAGIDDGPLGAIAADLEWFSIPGGWTLFREGDAANALYVVLSGTLHVAIRGGDDNTRVVAQIFAGETVGEMGLLSGAPRSATVVAARDTELVRLTTSAFETLIERHPRTMLRLTTLLADRLQRTTHQTARPNTPKTLALLALGPDVPIGELANGLCRVLIEAGFRTCLLDANDTERTTRSLHEAEAAHDFILYAGDSLLTPWTQLCLRQADRLLLIARPGPPGRTPMMEMLGKHHLNRSDMIIVQDDDRPQPQGTAAWLRQLPVEFHCHLRLGNRSDLSRVARLVTGRAVGLVLSGGGARGFAHLGVIRALHEAGVPLDLVGGSSIGAVIAAGVALERDDAELKDRMRRAFVETNPLSDYTIPLVSLVRGQKVSRLLCEHFGEGHIEDLWRPYFCVSSNLTTGRTFAHRSGLVWRALRASVALPGVLPPVVEAGEVLVDGGIINNFPVNIMSAMRRGPVIGVDVATDRALTAAAEDMEAGSLRSLLRQRRRNAPGIISLLMRAGTVGSEGRTRAARDEADILFEPPLEAIGIRDWHAFERAIDAGYRHAAETLERADLSFLLGGGT